MRAECLAAAAALGLLGCDPFNSGAATPCNQDAVVECVFAVSEGLDDECRRDRKEYPAAGCCGAVEKQLACFQGCSCDDQLGEGTHLRLMLLDTPLIAFGGLAEEIIDNYVQAAEGMCGAAKTSGMACTTTGGLV